MNLKKEIKKRKKERERKRKKKVFGKETRGTEEEDEGKASEMTDSQNHVHSFEGLHSLTQQITHNKEQNAVHDTTQDI